MCTYSMIMDWKYEEWNRRIYEPIQLPYYQHEADELRRLLDRAKEYDKLNNQPDCESEEKKKSLLIELANKLGVKINFEGQ